MLIRITDEARKYIHKKGHDSMTIESLHNKACCSIDYTGIVRLGKPGYFGFERHRILDIDTYVSGYMTGNKDQRDLTVRLVDMKFRKMLILDKNA